MCVSTSETLCRIREGLTAAINALSAFVPGAIQAGEKSFGRGPVTEADRAVDRVLRDVLVRDGEGWLSEESADDPSRLKKSRVWIVDPLDGTKEFVSGLPEWCVSIAMVEDGRAVAGGICNPATAEIFLGSLEQGVMYNGKSVRAGRKRRLEGALVLASRSEVKRGEWQRFVAAPFRIRPTGSVAYRLALVAAGLADATWTLRPRNEWDIAAGVALIEAAGGFARSLAEPRVLFNRPSTLIPGVFAGGLHLLEAVSSLLEPHARALPTGGEQSCG